MTDIAEEHARRIRAAWKLIKSAQAHLKEVLASVPRDKINAVITAQQRLRLEEKKNVDRERTAGDQRR